ncbi:hypothetical protein WU86_03980 [Corynebacterium xerosis]|nr:hypothetical protein WU86_03980 [Corynebacterium xerosis]
MSDCARHSQLRSDVDSTVPVRNRLRSSSPSSPDTRRSAAVTAICTSAIGGIGFSSGTRSSSTPSERS